MTTLLTRFCRDESGTTSTEYALIAMIISLVIIPVMTQAGATMSTTFTSVGGALTTANK